ncbi:putative transcriptional regulatory protein C2H10.01 [Ceratocystis platani]|uniref:Putative transcriptional regulatory protein C2H10.01 n=1 Tax=Ceratocystis fimbriata f. sp. platani TaxID=88771 RepID=A0A0F8BSM7_CERFI|nr:putative transcriptional regulatory protein C2H10.01 [Ceratocystis platani]
MVSNNYFNRRPSRVGPGYQLPYADRRQAMSHDQRSLISSDREGSNINEATPPRKRIAVACMRCRKRKIRCSGDDGTGASCHNCHNSGADNCQFLRVSSSETNFYPNETNSNPNFNYNINAARMFQSVPKSAPPPTPMMTPVVHSAYSDLSASSMPQHAPASAYSATSMTHTDAMVPYRQQQQPAYAAPCDKSYSTAAAVASMAAAQAQWSSSYGDQVDCNSMTAHYPYSHAPHIVSSGTPYRMADAMTPKNGHPHHAQHGSQAASNQMYVEVDAGYTYGNPPSAIQRSAITTQTHYPPYPSPISASTNMLGDSGDRVRPTPQRTNSTPAQVTTIYRTAAGSQSHDQFHHQTHGSGIVSDVSAAATSYASVYDMPSTSTSGYIPPPTTTSAGISSSSLSSSVSSIPRSDSSASTAIAETYNTASTASSEAVYSPTVGNSLHSASSSSDLGYRYSEPYRRSGSGCPGDLTSTSAPASTSTLHQMSSSQGYGSGESGVAMLPTTAQAESRGPDSLVLKQE